MTVKRGTLDTRIHKKAYTKINSCAAMLNVTK